MPTTRRSLALATLGWLAASCATQNSNNSAAPHIAPYTKAADIKTSQNQISLDTHDSMTTLAVVRMQRQISMYYKLDLNKDNSLSPAIANIMRENDEKIRSCYVNRLEHKPTLRGQVHFEILISKETGKIKKINPMKSGLQDAPLLLCMTQTLSQLPLNSPRNAGGTLVFSFDVLNAMVEK